MCVCDVKLHTVKMVVYSILTKFVNPPRFLLLFLKCAITIAYLSPVVLFCILLSFLYFGTVVVWSLVKVVRGW